MNRAAKNKFDRSLSLLRRLFFVPKCAGCQRRLYPIIKEDLLNRGKVCLCDICISSWQRARTEMCKNCGGTSERCTCLPNKRLFSQETIPSLFFYKPGEKSVENNIIYKMKQRKNKELFCFVALELSPALSKLLCECGATAEECIFTYIPRKRESLMRFSCDQGKDLCRSLCDELGGKFASLFVRSGGDEQKRLGERQRAKNIKSSVFLRSTHSFFTTYRSSRAPENLVSGKTVIIADDIMTTGATVSRGMRLLMDAGAASVIAVCVARSDMKGKK